MISQMNQKANHNQQPDVKEFSPSLGGGEHTEKSGYLESGKSEEYPPADSQHSQKTNGGEK